MSKGQEPSGKVAIETTSVAAGVGVQWGEGVLTFDGKKYPFSLQGLEVAGVGAAKVSAEGTVYNLQKPEDLAGRYVAAEAGIVAGGGPGVVAMRNQKGVVIYLKSAQQGVKLTLASQGVAVSLKEPVS